MRLGLLNPKLSRGEPYWQLTFDCPRCGPPFRVFVCVLPGPAPNIPGVWGITLPPGRELDDWSGVTLTPSIQNNHHGRATCGFHCSIIDGEVHP
jgi:hypothetical protein